MTCTCPIARASRTGIMYPARLLCLPCEPRQCACGKDAYVVEFQRPIRGEEPALPVASDDAVKFYCHDHMAFANQVEAKKLVVPPPLPTKTSRRGHIDPVWERNSTIPPLGSDSSLKVSCVACKRIHTLKQRMMWNGTKSYCPDVKCNEPMYVPTWEGEAHE